MVQNGDPKLIMYAAECCGARSCWSCARRTLVMSPFDETVIGSKCPVCRQVSTDFLPPTDLTKDGWNKLGGLTVFDDPRGEKYFVHPLTVDAVTETINEPPDSADMYSDEQSSSEDLFDSEEDSYDDTQDHTTEPPQAPVDEQKFHLARIKELTKASLYVRQRWWVEQPTADQFVNLTTNQLADLTTARRSASEIASSECAVHFMMLNMPMSRLAESLEADQLREFAAMMRRVGECSNTECIMKLLDSQHALHRLVNNARTVNVAGDVFSEFNREYGNLLSGCINARLFTIFRLDSSSAETLVHAALTSQLFRAANSVLPAPEFDPFQNTTTVSASASPPRLQGRQLRRRRPLDTQPPSVDDSTPASPYRAPRTTVPVAVVDATMQNASNNTPNDSCHEPDMSFKLPAVSADTQTPQ